MNTPASDNDAVERLRAQIADVMSVDSVTILRQPADAVMFRGRLQTDSDKAFERIQPRFEALGYTPSLQRSHDQDVLTALPGLQVVKASNPIVNLILFLLTVATTFLTGALYGDNFNVLNGILFSGSILTILGAHEFGHYFVARYYKAPVTLPYFIPMPPIVSPIGTLGAVIRLKAPFVNRKSLFDVGIAGPLAGMVFAIPILFIGLSMSSVDRCPIGQLCMQEGNSLLYAFVKYAVFGRFLPAGGLDVQLSPVAWAGWVGLFVTALNLLPAGQLDGGHIIFALLGKHARNLGWATVVVLAILALPALLPTAVEALASHGLPAFLPTTIDLSFLGIRGLNYPGYFGWFVWVGLIYMTGVNHPVPLNDISDLGLGRKILGFLAIILFVLLFTPLPFSVS
jgi:membrane-associated protease RseP (regulator of RpoE activity)